MATYVLIHGAGSGSWYWHLVAPQLRARGHDVVAPDLPSDDDSAGLAEYVDAVVEALTGNTGNDGRDDPGDNRAHGRTDRNRAHGRTDRRADGGDHDDDVVVVAQSMAGFTAPLLCDRVRVDLLVLLAAMIPLPGESPGDWWDNTGHERARREHDEREGRPVGGEFDPAVTFLHDLPPHLKAEAMRHGRDQSGTPFTKPWPRTAWPDVPTRVLICRDDRFFPAGFMRRVAIDRLGITPDEMPGGHLPALAQPEELVERLEAYRTGPHATSGR
jgi:pimeloyl-ACP methyl ester carboxylesterase